MSLTRGQTGTVNVQAEIDSAVTTAASSAASTYQPLTGNSIAFASLPAAASNVGRVLYCADGSAGAACAVISDGTNWKVIAIGATAADS